MAGKRGAGWPELPRGWSLRASAWLTLWAISGAPAAAQNVQGDQTRFRAPTAEEINRQPQAPPPARARVDAAPAFTPARCPDELVNAPETLPLTAVTFVSAGGGALDPGIAAVLARVAAAQPLGNQRLKVICDVRDAADAALQRVGYVATVLIPEQTVTAGHLTLQVVTGRIKEVRVRGSASFSRRRVEAVLERLKRLDPLRERDAEAILLEANAIPGTAVRLELRPSGEPGLLIADVSIDQVRESAFVSLNDLGSREIGRFGGQIRAEVYGITGLSDRTYLSGFSTSDFKEQQVIQFGHDFAPGRGQLRLGGQFSYAWTHPTLQNGGGLELRARSLLATVDASYPIIVGVGRSLVADGGIDFIDQRTSAGRQLVNLDKLRIGFVRLDGDFAERVPPGLAPTWHVAASLGVRQGTSWLGATRRGQISGTAIPTRIEGNPEATVARGEIAGEARARFARGSPFAVTVALSGRGQYTESPLLAYEELAVGNLTIGRGYDPGANSADRAFGGTAELRIGKPLPVSSRDLAYEAFGFYDTVRIFNLDTGATENRRTLASVGGGVRLIYGGRARFDVTYAKPLDKAFSFDTAKPPPRLLFTLTVKAWP